MKPGPCEESEIRSEEGVVGVAVEGATRVVSNCPLAAASMVLVISKRFFKKNSYRIQPRSKQEGQVLGVCNSGPF